MHEGHSSGWLQRTGQRWKLAVFGLTVGLAFVLIAGSDLSSRRHTYPLWPNLVGVLAMATAFLWFWSSVRVSGLCEIRCEVGTHQGSGPRLVPLACPPSAMPALWGRRGHHWHLIATLWPMALQTIRFHVQAYLQYQGRLLRRNLRSPRLGASRHWSGDPFRETSLVSSASSWDLVSGCHDRRRMRLVFGRTLVLPQLR